MKPQYSAVLLRYGEIGIKSRQTRRRMTAMLVRHLKTSLEENSVHFSNIREEFGRIFIETDEAFEAAEVASRIFGLVSTSPVVVTSADLKLILEKGEDVAREAFDRDCSFAVRARRMGQHEFSSQDIREKLGERILSGLSDMNLTVNLDSPHQTVYVEVRHNRSYLYTDIIEGVGGMPTGTQGRVVCTISGGLDSPVAAYKVMKRGCVPVFLFFDNIPFGDELTKEIAIKQAKRLAEYIPNHEVKMYVVPHREDLIDVLENTPRRMTCIFCRRNMYRLAQEVALREDADAIVTGEIIGEQASQTTRNLRVESEGVCKVPILRPCIGDDKVDVERVAREIGTYDLAAEAPSCCSLPPKWPVVHAHLDDVEKHDGQLDLDVLEDEVSQARVMVLRGGHTDN
ncbi:MAG: tRNA uracil 4-sulfurtransferase ThiI [Promethearchaeia archaeon]